MTLEEIKNVKCSPGSKEKFCPELSVVYKKFLKLLKLSRKNSLISKKQICRSFKPLSKNFKFCRTLKLKHLKRVRKRILGTHSPKDISSALADHCLESPKSMLCEKIFILGKIVGDTNFSTLAGCPMGTCEFNHWKRWNRICSNIAWEIGQHRGDMRWSPDRDLPNRTDYWKCTDEVQKMRRLKDIYNGEFVRRVREHHKRSPMSNGVITWWTYRTVKAGDGSGDDWADVVPIADKVLQRMREHA